MGEFTWSVGGFTWSVGRLTWSVGSIWSVVSTWSVGRCGDLGRVSRPVRSWWLLPCAARNADGMPADTLIISAGNTEASPCMGNTPDRLHGVVLSSRLPMLTYVKGSSMVIMVVFRTRIFTGVQHLSGVRGCVDGRPS